MEQDILSLLLKHVVSLLVYGGRSWYVLLCVSILVVYLLENLLTSYFAFVPEFISVVGGFVMLDLIFLCNVLDL
jgi:hypothetical protein